MDETSSTLADKSALTVSALSNALRRTLEERFGIVRVRGEISGFRGPHASGHLYFALKDDGARLDAVIWKSTFQKMRVKPAEGLEVVASGKLTTFPGKSSYQIVIDSVEPAGVGALMTMLEARRRQLASEGLFDIACKQPLPFLPTVVGVVTSPSGSVIRDILHRLADRFPIHVIIWPVRVQGDNSAEEIANAIAGFNALSEDGSVPRPDVVIVARGGGSLEDLWSFNEENVVRAAHESKIPLVSAIGHETDWTLIDHAADYRAPTPTAAAEICVPVRSQLVARVGVAKGRLVEACRRLGQRNKTELRAISRGLPSASDVASGPRQRLDSLGDGLNSRMRFCFSANELAISATIRRHANCSPRVQLSRASERISIAAIQLVGFANSLRVHGRVIMDRVESELLHCSTSTTRRRRDLLGTNTNRWIICSNLTRRYTAELVKTFALLSTRLSFGISGLVDRERSEFENVEQLFRAVNHMAVLARGYAFIRDKFGVPISSAGAAANVKQLRIQFIDAEIVAKIINKQAAKIGDAKFKDIEQDVLFELS